MAFVPVQDVLEVAVKYRLQGQEVVNVYNIWKAGWDGASDIPALMDIFSTWTQVSEKSLRANQMVLTGISMRDLSSEGGHTWSLPFDNLPGGMGTNMLPNNVAVALTLNTMLGGRSYRGRTYRAGHTILSVSASTVQPLWLRDMLIALEALKQALAAIGWLWSIVSRYTNKAARANGVKTPITTISAFDNISDSQRRRLPGRGA